MSQLLKKPAAKITAILAGSVVLFTGCSEPVETVQSVVVNGRIEAPDGLAPDGTVTVKLFHAWSLDGVLRHPRAEIESFTTSPGEFTHRFDYPTERGEGLLVYAWLDTDGDGVHCTPDRREDIAGLTEAATPESGEVSVTVELTEACAGPDWFFPPLAKNPES